ncbi:MAG: YbaK/EbsC family protein [Betaproteobacteria bacterium]|nr:YbaK/EbsC family protein [Betaproteobacteria bacterium]
MSISPKLMEYMHRYHVEYEVFSHPRTASSMETVRVAHIPGERLAKSVILEDDKGYVMAVVPANARVHLGELSKQMHRKLRLAGELEVNRLFDDCAPGAIPPVGPAYGVETIVEETLQTQPDIFIEAGDHTELIHLSLEQFMEMMTGVRHGHFLSHY